MPSNFPPAGYKRFNCNMPSELHLKLKMAGVMTGVPMGDLIQQLIKDELDNLLKKGIK